MGYVHPSTTNDLFFILHFGAIQITNRPIFEILRTTVAKTSLFEKNEKDTGIVFYNTMCMYFVSFCA